ncbi:hypothetical protein H0W26_05515 [Candidatus Dependentiae bacterium]|nr:hypothetical protein [Candidatus Dependentiae bacterium]
MKKLLLSLTTMLSVVGVVSMLQLPLNAMKSSSTIVPAENVWDISTDNPQDLNLSQIEITNITPQPIRVAFSINDGPLTYLDIKSAESKQLNRSPNSTITRLLFIGRFQDRELGSQELATISKNPVALTLTNSIDGHRLLYDIQVFRPTSK